jgi:circadian clock protein KaiB
MKKKPVGHEEALAEAGEDLGRAKYVLRLFVAGLTPKSEKAIRSVKDICEEHLKGRYELEVIDIYQHPGSLAEEQVVVAPTLVKKLPLPLRRLIGDMASKEKVLVGLDLRPKNERETK